MNAKTSETGRALTREEMVANMAEVAAGMQAAETGPPKLSEEATELFKAFEAELVAMRRRILELEIKCGPFTVMLEHHFNREIERRLGMRLEKQNAFMNDKGCEVSPLEVMRFKYNIGA